MGGEVIMKKEIYKRILVLAIICLTSGTLISCGDKDKETVISNDVKQDVKEEDTDIEDNITQGNDYLDQGNHEDAKKSYEKAISIDKLNKNTYLKIKDKYIEKRRFDDAFYIIKLAIDSNVDPDGMKIVQEDIKKNFELITIEKAVYQNNSVSLPKEITIKLNNEIETKTIVNWNNNKVDTTKIGTFSYQGDIQEYGRKVNLSVNVLPIINEKKIGYLKKVFEKNEKRYLDIDEVGFYTGQAAVEEGKKDGKAILDETGKYVMPSDYYIRNKSNEVKTYEVSNNSKQSLCLFVIDKKNSNVDLQEVSFQQFEKYMNNREYDLIWIYTENNIVTKIEMQFRP